MIQRVKFLWLVHVVANLLLLALAWLWLGIPDARTWHLGVTGLLGLVILFAALWLHGSTFRFFGDEGPPLHTAFTATLRRLPVFGLWAAIWIGATLLLQRWLPAGP